MVKVKMRYVVEKNGNLFYEPSAKMKLAGIKPQPLGEDPAAAYNRAAELNAEWDTMRSGRPVSEGPVTFKRLVDLYQASSWYTVLRDKTQREVDPCLAVVIEALGAVPVGAVSRKHIRMFHVELEKRKGQHYANKVIKWLRRILELSIELEIRTDNPAAKMKLKHPKPRRQQWEPEQVKAVVDKALELGLTSWAAAAMIAYDSAQRRDDVVGLRWADYDGEGITVRQNKTDANIWIPLYPDTIALLDQMKEANSASATPSLHIINGLRGRPIKGNEFGKKMRAVMNAAGLPSDLQFRDLRRTAATEIFKGGGAVEPITGHVVGSKMLQTYVAISDRDKDTARASQAKRKRK